MLYLGIVLGIVAGNYAANVAGLASARVYVAMILLLIPGLVGARLLFVATNWDIYRREPRRIWDQSDGGAGMQGGLPFIVAASIPLLGALGVPFFAFWDVATFTMLIGLMFARVGCLLNGCCCGRPADGWLALYLPNCRGVWFRRIPTQILEGGWAALLLAGAVGFWSCAPFPGAVFLATVAAYSIGRFGLEALRESQSRVGAMNVQRALSLGFGVLAATGLVIAWAFIDT